MRKPAKVSGSIDPYKILGIAPGASLEEVRQAYRRAATKYHPDVGGDAWAFQQVQQAYDILRNDLEGETPIPSSRPPAQPTQARSPGNKSNSSSQQTKNQSTQANRQSSRNATEKTAHYSGAGTAGLKQWLFGHPLRLHNETSYFILANFMDLVMTGILLRYSAVEANPIANFFYQRWGFYGMVGLKIASVVFVCLLAQSIAGRSESKARILLIGGTLLVSAVVVYSMFLAQKQLAP